MAVDSRPIARAVARPFNVSLSCRPLPSDDLQRARLLRRDPWALCCALSPGAALAHAVGPRLLRSTFLHLLWHAPLRRHVGRVVCPHLCLGVAHIALVSRGLALLLPRDC